MRKQGITLLLTGTLILSSLFFGLLITWVGWTIRIPVTGWHLPLAVALAILLLRQAAGKGIQQAVLWSLLVFIVAMIVASILFDYSFDGQVYHQAMVASLRMGWNPVYEHHNGTIPLHNVVHLINNHYLRGIETIESLFYASTGWIEAGKAVNLLLMTASFLLCLFALRQKFEMFLTDRKLWLLAILFTCCPVVITQVLTFYIDYAMYSLLLSLLSLMIIIGDKDFKLMNIIVIGMIVAVAVTIKLNIFFFVGVTIILYLAWLAYRRQSKLFRQIFIVSTVAAVLGGLLFNYNPLVTNRVDHGHFLYPLMVSESSQEKAWDIMTPQTPLNMRDNNRLTNVGVSFFGRLQHSVDSTGWGVPTTLLEWVMLADTRVGGFGQFFGLTLLFSLILYCSVKVQGDTRRKVFGWVLIASVFSLFVFAEGWWARYVPFFWWVPLVMMLYWESAINKKCWQRWLAKANYFLISLNVLIACLSAAFLALSYTKNSVEEFKQMSTRKQPVKIWFGSNVSIEDKLSFFGVHYTKLNSDVNSTATFEWVLRDNTGLGTKLIITCPHTSK